MVSSTTVVIFVHMFGYTPSLCRYLKTGVRSAVANKKYPHHGHKTPFYAKICRINAGLRASPVHVEKDIILQKTAQFSPL